jgi:hypothetical protein
MQGRIDAFLSGESRNDLSDDGERDPNNFLRCSTHSLREFFEKYADSGPPLPAPSLDHSTGQATKMLIRMTPPTGHSLTLSVDSTATVANLKVFFVQHYPAAAN